jgi:hypothetical protein
MYNEIVINFSKIILVLERFSLFIMSFMFLIIYNHYGEGSYLFSMVGDRYIRGGKMVRVQMDR